MVLVFGGWQEYFWPYSLNECLIFYLQCQEMLKPSESQWTHFPFHHPLFFLQQNLEWDASSCWWSLKLLSISHRGKYIYFHFIFCTAVRFPILSFQWNSPEWCSCCSRRGTGFVLLKCIYSSLLHSPYWDAANLWWSEVFSLPNACDYILGK